MTPEFFQVFAKNNLIKNIFEEEKKNMIFFGKKSPTGLQANQGTVRKSAIFPQPSNQKQLKRSNTAYVNI